MDLERQQLPGILELPSQSKEPVLYNGTSRVIALFPSMQNALRHPCAASIKGGIGFLKLR